MSFSLVKEGGEMFHSVINIISKWILKNTHVGSFWWIFFGCVLMVVGFSLLKIFEEGDQREGGFTVIFHILPHKTLSYFFLFIIWTLMFWRTFSAKPSPSCCLTFLALLIHFLTPGTFPFWDKKILYSILSLLW